MNNITLKDIEKVLDEKVRPSLASHQGNVTIVEYKDKVLKVRLTGKCSGCPSAQLTTENVIASAVKDEIPEIEDVILVTGVSDDLIEQAKMILQMRHQS